MFRNALMIVSLCSAAAQAHFLWVAPGAAKDEAARLHFSETPAPGEPELLDRVAGAKVVLTAADGTAKAGEAVKGADGWIFRGSAPAQAHTSFAYGVLSRGGSAPFLLNYHARGVFASVDAVSACSALKLDMTSQKAADGTLTLTVLFEGKPLAQSKFVVACADGKPVEGTTDADGRFKYKPDGKGVVGIRASHVEKVGGELGGKKYESIRHYITLTLPASAR